MSHIKTNIKCAVGIHTPTTLITCHAYVVASPYVASGIGTSTYIRVYNVSFYRFNRYSMENSLY